MKSFHVGGVQMTRRSPCCWVPSGTVTLIFMVKGCTEKDSTFLELQKKNHSLGGRQKGKKSGNEVGTKWSICEVIHKAQTLRQNATKLAAACFATLLLQPLGPIGSERGSTERSMAVADCVCRLGSVGARQGSQGSGQNLFAIISWLTARREEKMVQWLLALASKENSAIKKKKSIASKTSRNGFLPTPGLCLGQTC